MTKQQHIAGRLLRAFSVPVGKGPDKDGVLSGDAGDVMWWVKPDGRALIAAWDRGPVLSIQVSPEGVVEFSDGGSTLGEKRFVYRRHVSVLLWALRALGVEAPVELVAYRTEADPDEEAAWAAQRRAYL